MAAAHLSNPVSGEFTAPAQYRGLGILCLLLSFLLTWVAIIDPYTPVRRGAPKGTMRELLPREQAVLLVVLSGVAAALLGLKRGIMVQRTADGGVVAVEAWDYVPWAWRRRLSGQGPFAVRLRLTGHAWQVAVEPRSGRSAVLVTASPARAIALAREAAVALHLPLRTNLPLPEAPAPWGRPALTFDLATRRLTWELADREGRTPPPVTLSPSSRLIIGPFGNDWELGVDGVEPDGRYVPLHRRSMRAVESATELLSALLELPVVTE